MHREKISYLAENSCIARRFHPSQKFTYRKKISYLSEFMHREKISFLAKFYASREDPIPRKILCIARRFHPSQIWISREHIHALQAIMHCQKRIVHLKGNIYPSMSIDVKCRGEKLRVDKVEDTVSHLNCIFKMTSFILVFVKSIRKDEFLQKKRLKKTKKNRCKVLQQGRNTSLNLLETGLGLTSTTCNHTSLQRSCVQLKLDL